MGDEILKTIIKQMKAQDRNFELYGAKLMRFNGQLITNELVIL